MLDQQLRNAAEAAAGGLVKRRGAGLVANLNVGAADDQQRGQLLVAAVHGEVQRRGAGVIGRPKVGAIGQQELHHPQIVLDAGVSKRLGTPLGVTGLDVGAMVQEEPGDFKIAAPGHIVQRRGAHLVGLVDVRAAGDLPA